MTSSYNSVFKPDLFAGQVIIVTGGGSGIGRCTAHELSSLGAQLILIGRKQEKLETVQQEIIEDGGKADIHALDIREEDAVNKAVKQVVEAHGRIDGLVNNAGGQFASPLAMISTKGFEKVLATNVLGTFNMMRAAYQQWMYQNGGVIVNMAAEMWNGMPTMGHSGAARAGVVNLTKTAAFEWGPCGIRTNTVAPGWIASSGFDTYDEQTQSMIPHLKEHVPLRRIATEAEVAAVITFLLSPASAYINGETIKINGGADTGGSLFNTFFSTGTPAIGEPPENSKPVPMIKALLGSNKGNDAYQGFHRAVTPEALRDGEES
jgi:citronellol/citronellal dehydrogenase